MTKMALFIPFSLSLVACGSVEAPTPPGPIRGLLEVLGVEVAILESFPPQAVATVEGKLPTVCTDIEEVRVRREKRLVEVTISTISTAQACILILPPPVKVPVHLGFFDEPGEYVLRVNGFERRFRI